MSYTVTKYPHGTFCWADLLSTDITASKKFLTGLFGWNAEDMPTEPGKPDYTMFTVDGKNVAGGSPAFDPSMPSFWNNYIAVNNVDEIVKKAEELGGKVTMPAMDVLDSGRMATIQDPTGAHVSLWQAKKHIGASLINTFGAMSWNELYTKDVEKSKDFYSKLLGWTFDTDQNTGYITIKNGERSNGGIFKITPEIEGMPPSWVVYFTVKNISESVEKVKELGGSADMGIKDIGVGKISMIADPTKAHLMLIELSVPPTEWTE